MKHNEIPPDEEALLQRLARRQHEAEETESRLVERYGNRAALAKQVWSAILGIVGAAVLGTAYVLSLKSEVERSARDIVQLRADVNRNTDRVETLRLEMKDKQDRKREP